MTHPSVVEAPTEEECYLYAILTDPSGIDQAEFLWYVPEVEDHKFCRVCDSPKTGAHNWEHPLAVDEDGDDVAQERARWYDKYVTGSGCFRTWPFQWNWWRCQDRYQVDQGARSIGKTEGIKARGCAFPFVHPGQKMLLTAPELIHLDPITQAIEYQMYATRLYHEMLVKGRSGVTHRPFLMQFQNGAQIFGRIPQKDGRGVKGQHPLWLELDECFPAGTLVTTKARGQVPIEDVEVGERVLTHRRRWRAVTNKMSRHRPTVRLKGHGHPGFRASVNHKFWACDEDQRYVISDGGLQLQRTTEGPEWVCAGEMQGAFWGTPAIYPQVKHVPAFRKPGTNGKVPWEKSTVASMWLVGLWVAEGSYNPKAYQVTWSVHVDEVAHVGKVLDGLGLKWRAYKAPGKCCNVVVGNVALGEWLVKHFRKGARSKQVPSWMLGLKREFRSAFLEGLVWGDGFQDPDPRYKAGRWKLSTSSHALAVSTRMLAISLGWWTTVFWVDPPSEPKFIRGRQIHGGGWYQVVGNPEGQGFDFDHIRYTRCKEVEPTGEVEELWDLTVDEDHSFVAEGFTVSNCQDYPASGWIELRETLLRGMENAIWRAHGVTRGVRDDFFEITQDTPDNPWTIHRYNAMYRPTWSDEEREEKIQQYGGRNDPDYRRNVLGLHGDKTNPIFVASALIARVDVNELSDYNTEEYYLLKATVEDLELRQMHMIDALEFPSRHLSYLGDIRHRATNPGALYWSGMDIGMTIEPSEILVFVEYNEKPKDQYTKLKLLTRIQMSRMPTHEQLHAILAVIDFYQPKAFSMDKAGNGMPFFQLLQHYMEASATDGPEALPAAVRHFDLASSLTTIKGYNFSEKVSTMFDTSVEPEKGEDPKLLKRYGNEWGTDVLRELVDAKRLQLPWDTELLKQFQGGTYHYQKDGRDAYGRRSFNKGDDHCLDAARFFALGWSLHTIEQVIGQKKIQTPVLDRFMAS